MNNRLFDAEIELIVKDRKGRIIVKRREKAHSWTVWFLWALEGLMKGGVRNKSVQIIDINGDWKTYPDLKDTASCMMCANAPQGEVKYGILIGSDDTPYSESDNKLFNQIYTVSYGETKVNDVVYAGTEWRLVISRTFAKNSGNTVTVKEIGLAVAHGTENEPIYFLIARDVLSSPVDVPNNASLTVNYVIRMPSASSSGTSSTQEATPPTAK